MKRYLLLLFFIFNCALLLPAQQVVQWAWQHDYNISFVDIEYRQGYLYAVGNFTADSVNLGTGVIVNHGESDMVVVKSDTNGNIIWVRHYGGSGHDSLSNLTLDNDGNVYVVGNFKQTLVTSAGTLNSAFGGVDVCMLKFDSAGTLLIARRAGGEFMDTGIDIAVDFDQNIYIVGYSPKMAFASITSYTDASFFIKFDALGNPVFLRWFSGGAIPSYPLPQSTINYIASIKFLPTDSTLVMGGYFNGGVLEYYYNSVNGITEIANNGANPGAGWDNQDIYLAKVDRYGTLQWFRNVTGSVVRTNILSDICIDQGGNIWCAQRYQYGLNGFSSNRWVKYDTNGLETGGVSLNQSPVYGYGSGGTGKLFYHNNTIYGIIRQPMLGYTANDECAEFMAMQVNTITNVKSFVYIGPRSYKGDSVHHGISGSYFLSTGVAGVNGRYFLGSRVGLGKTCTSACPLGINPSPDTALCLGSSVRLTNVCNFHVYGGSPPYTYNWNPAVGLSNAAIANPMVSGITTPTTYTLTVTDQLGNIAYDTITVSIHQLPIVSASISDDSVCSGASIILQGSGAMWYNWTSVPWSYTPNNVPFVVTASNTYTVTGGDANGCTNTSSISIHVNALPVVSAMASDTVVCVQDTLSVHGNGAVSYVWSGGVSDGVPFTSTASQTYTVTGTDGNGCTNTSSISIQVNALPMVSAMASDTVVCAQDTLSVHGNGAISYVWSGGVSDGVPFTSGASQTYTVTGTDGNGCTNTSSISIQVNALPVVSAMASDTVVCVQDTLSVHGNGAVSYVWSGGVSDGVPFTSGVSQTYTVTGTDGNGCTNTSSISIQVNALPVVSAMASDTVVCAQDTLSVHGIGALSYLWSGGVSDGVPFTSSASQTYTVTGTDGNGCTNTSSISIHVNALPVVSAIASDTVVCAQDTLSVYGSGASSYVWSGGVSDGVSFTSSVSQTYTVTGTDGNGCTNTSSISIQVNALPMVSAIASDTVVCAQDTLSVHGNGAVSYVWSGGVSDGVPFTSGASQTYTVTGTDGNGCTNTSSISIQVNALPVVSAMASDTVVCAQDTLSVYGSGAVSYVWSGGVSDGVPFTSGASQTYTVTGTDGNGCTNTSSISIQVNALPVVSAMASDTVVCAQDTLSVHGNGTLSYVWSGGVSDGVPFTSGASQTYTVTGTDGNGCTNTSSISIQVNALPVVSAMASDTVICAQDTVSVHGNGALSYVWSGGVSDGVPFTSNASQTYTVTGTDGNGCTNTSSMFILAHPLPQPIITQISTNLICTNVANCSYSWTLNGVQLDTTVFITVSQNGTYYVHVTDINGCSNSDSIVLTAVNTHELLDMTVPFELYPNPTQGVFNLQYFVPSSGRVSFSIFDMSGRCVNKLTQLDYHEKGKYDMQVDLNQMGIADGLYVLLMQTDNLRWIKRFQLVR